MIKLPEAQYYDVVPEFTIYTWCPSLDASGPATQVHLHFGTSPGPIIVVRLKSRREADELISTLQTHRDDVWNEDGTSRESAEREKIFEAAARAMFHAYNAQGPNPNKTWDGRDVPPWESLGEQVQGKWIAAAKAAVIHTADWVREMRGE